MSMVSLVEYEDADGDYVSAWFDKEEDAVVVQYNYVHITMTTDQFEGYAEAMARGLEALKEEI